MGYLGNKPTAVPIESSDLADNLVTSAKIANGAITGDDINSTFNIGSKTVTLPAASVTAHVTQTDLTPVRQDVLTLALKQAVQENSTKFNLPNSAIVKFEADADFNLAGSTTIVRNASEYISPIAGGWTVDTGGTLDTNKLAHYPWNNSDDDLTDTNELTAEGSPTYSTGTKKLGTHALELNASTEAFAFTSGAPSWGSPSVISMATWAYWSDTSGGFNMIFDGYGTSSSQSFIFGMQDSNDYMASYDDGTKSWVYGTSAVSKNTWVHLAFVLTTTAKKFYLNGSLAGNTAGSYTLGTANAHNRIGARSDDTHGWNGHLDQTLFWNKEISAQEVTDLYNSGTGNTYSSASVSATGTALGTTNVPSSAVTDVSGVMLLKHAYGANTLGTDVKVYFTADNSNWTEATSYADAGTFSTGIKMIKLGKTTCTSGSDVRWKVVWANQAASSKEAHIYGIGLNY